ncbi:MAG: MATE family efflux transporter [Janthinobacterium lividum]
MQPVRRLLPYFAAHRLGGQSILAFGFKAWGAIASFALNWLIARHFGAAGSGHFGIAITTLTITSYFVLIGFDTILVRTVAGDLHQHKTAEARGAVVAITRTIAITAPIVAIILFLLRGPLANQVLHQPLLAEMLGIMLWAVVPLTLQRIASAALRASGSVLQSQFIDGPVGTTLAALLLGGAILTGLANSMLVPAALYLIGVIVSCVVGWLSFRTVSHGWPRAIMPAVLPLAIAGLPILASNLSNVFTEWYTTVSLGAHWPAAVVGQYRAAWQFVALAGLVQLAMDSILGPRVAAAARAGDTEQIGRIARRAILLVLALASPLFALIFIFPGFLLHIFGPQFVPAARALQILGIGQLARLAFGPLGLILVMTGHQRWTLAYAAVAVVLCILLCIVLIPRYGVEGAAMATTLTVVLRNIGAAVVVQLVLRINLLPWRRPS